MNAIVNPRRIINRRALIAEISLGLEGKYFEPPMRSGVVSQLKVALQTGYIEIRERFETSGNSLNTLAENSLLIDQLVRVIFDIATDRVYPVANRSTSERLSVIAIGGYGRGELAPHSDIDLMFLHPYKQAPYIEQVVEFVLYMLWDLGLNVGHSTRSINDCIRLSKDDIKVQTSLLDARWLWGEQRLFRDLQEQYNAEIVTGHGPGFVEAKLRERDERLKRTGDTRYVLEPNIKEGKGGLRDLQTLYWLTKFLYGVSNLSELEALNVFTSQDVNLYTKAHDFLWTVRCHLHYLAGRPEERLTFDVQKCIGEKMHYADRIGVSGVERFMKHYFLMAKDVGNLTRVLCAVLEDQQKKKSFFTFSGLPRRRSKINGFICDQGRITVENDSSFRQDPMKLLLIFSVAQDQNLDLHPHALRLINHNLHLISRAFRENPEANAIFLRMLTSKKDPETTLRRLNEAGVFGKFIPDFGQIVAQMEFSMYHSYTVDEHTIRAIGILSRIESGHHSQDMPNVTKAMKEVHSRRALYVALFLHDISKGRGGDHSRLGADLALNLGPRLGLNAEETETVSWLVREHLTMSDTAFKRDFDDPKTVKDFVGIVKSIERLRLLTVLTCADICAVGPKTWTSWKSSLLRGLFLKTLEFLSGDMVGENRAKRIIQAKNRFREGLVGWQKNEVEQHISNGSPSYWLSYDTDTHMQHAKIIQKAKRKNISVHIESRLNETFDYSEITVYAPDHPGIFSEIAGVMALSNVTVMDAKIATMANGMVLDSFAFIDTASQAVTSPDKIQKIADRIEKTLAGKLNIELELKAAPLKNLKKSVEAFTVASRVIVNNNASSSDTVIEVNGRDRVGLLYDLTATLTRLGLKISSAHITTFGEEVVDTFYIKDAFGLKVSHKEKIQKIRQTLLKAVPANNPKNNFPGEQLISPTL